MGSVIVPSAPRPALSEMSFDTFYKVVSIFIGSGIFVGVWRLVIWAIRFGPRFNAVEKETAAHGAMIQQLTASIARIEGWIGGSEQWDGKTERRGQQQHLHREND